MGRLTFTSGLISDLRQRVIAHNEAPGASATKLGDLKKVYQTAYRGQNPGEQAMGAVDRHLENLSKAFDGGKHPRGQKGEFSRKGGGTPLAPPISEEAHTALQVSNPTYRALTTEVIPEHRNELLGNTIRSVGAASLGLGAIASLARGRPNSLVRRGTEALAGHAGKYLASVPIGAAGYAAHAATRRISPRILSEAEVHTAIEQAAKVGQVAGRFVGRHTFGVASHGVRSVIDASGSSAAAQGRKRTAIFRRGLAFAGLSTVPALMINSAVKDSPLDPAGLGRSVDSYSYRTIQKMADSPEIAAAYRAMVEVMQKGGSADDLRKAGPGLYSTYGKALLSTIAAGAGAALSHGATKMAIGRGLAVAGATGAGALAGEAIGARKDKGNPNHDAKGRFTSGQHAAAVGGAVVGGALAGGAALLALRSHNVAAFAERSGNLFGRIAEATRAALHNNPRGTPHGELFANRANLIQAEFDADAAYKKASTALQQHGKDPALHYQTLVRQHINNKLTDILSGHDTTALPTGKGKNIGAQVWAPIKDLRGKGKTAEESIRKKILDHVERMDPASFERAVAGLPDAPRKAALELFRKRGSEVAKVADTLADHPRIVQESAEALDDLDFKKAAAGRHRTAAESAVRVAKAGSPEEHAAAQQAYQKADAARDDAIADHAEAKRAHDAMVARGPVVLSPVTDHPLPPPGDSTVVDLFDNRSKKLRDSAWKKATESVDAKIADARSAHVAKISRYSNQALAAHSLHGLRAGVIPKDAQAAAEALQETHAAVRRQEAVVNEAATDEAVKEQSLKTLKSLGVRKTLPKGMTQADADHMRDNAENIRAAHKASISLTNTARSELERLNALRNIAAKDYTDSMVASGQMKPTPRGRVAAWIPQELQRDLTRVTSGPRNAVRALMAAPGAAAMKAFASSVVGHDSAKPPVGAGVTAATAAGKTINNAAVGAYQELFMRQTSPGGPYTHSAVKIAIHAANAGTALTAGREALEYARAKVFGGEGGTPAKLPEQLKLDHKIDAVTGQGFTTVSIPDRSNPADRVVLWGQTYDDIDKAPKPLHIGGSLSSVKQRMAEKVAQHNNQGGGNLGDAPGLNDGVKKSINEALGKIKSQNKLKSAPAGPGGEAVSRDPNWTDQAHVNLSNTFKDHVAAQVNRGEKKNALMSLFSSQGRILTRSQQYELLTGFKSGGEKTSKKGIFHPEDAGFGSSDPDTVMESLGNEIGKNSKTAAADEVMRKHLHRAIATIAGAKRLTPDSVTALHHQLATGVEMAISPAPAEPLLQAVPKIKHAHEVSVPGDWTHHELKDAADRATDDLSESGHLEFDVNHDHGTVRKMVMRLASAAHQSFPDEGMTAKEGVEAAYAAIQQMADGGSVHQDLTLAAIRNGDLDRFTGAILDHSRATLDQRMQNAALPDRKDPLHKAELLDDLDALLKVFPLLAKSDEEGVGVGARIVKEVAEGGVEQAQGKLRRTFVGSSSAPQSFLHPVRVANELGGNIASDTAWNIANSLATRFLPGGGIAHAAEEAVEAAPGLRGLFSSGVASAKKAITMRNAGIQAISLGASSGFGMAGSAAANAGVKGAYALAGSRAPEYSPEEDTPMAALGRAGASIVGNIKGMSYGRQWASAAGKALGGTETGQAAARVIGAGVNRVAGGVAESALGRIGGGVVGRIASGIGARAVGAEAGELLGSVLGPVGSVVGGAVLGWGAGQLGSYVGKYFDGYDKPTVDRVLAAHVPGAAGAAQRHVPAIAAAGGATPPAPAPSPGLARAAPSGMGGRGGDPNHDQRGRFA